jgi:hypothetical protein
VKLRACRELLVEETDIENLARLSLLKGKAQVTNYYVCFQSTDIIWVPTAPLQYFRICFWIGDYI